MDPRHRAPRPAAQPRKLAECNLPTDSRTWSSPNVRSPNPTGLTIAASKPFEHRRPRLSLRNSAKLVRCIETVSLRAKGIRHLEKAARQWPGAHPKMGTGSES